VVIAGVKPGGEGLGGVRYCGGGPAGPGAPVFNSAEGVGDELRSVAGLARNHN
jgi:hypothetical protein